MATKTFKIGLSNADKAAMAQDVYERLIGMSFDEYDSSKTYNEGDFVVYEDPADTFKLYKCNSDNVTGAWDSTKWDLATFQTLVDDIEDAVAFVNDKANVDGNYPTMTVGAADNLTPYDKESGADQEQPFLLQGTGCGNGEQQVDTGALALLKEKQGNSKAVNQLFDYANISTYSYVNGSSTKLNNVVSLTPSDYSQEALAVRNFTYKNNHKYLYIASIRASSGNGTLTVSAWYRGGIVDKSLVISNDTSYKQFILTFTGADDVLQGNFTFGGTVGSGTIDCKEQAIIDLTQWFNGDIPAHLLSHPEDFFRYYQGSLAYNEGELVNSNGRYLKTFGRNCYNLEETYNRVIPNQKYFVSKSTTITYYDKDENLIGTENVSAKDVITIPTNCIYINSSVASITISIAYFKDAEETELESGYIDNGTAIEYPYEELANIDTGTETLRSAGSVKDSKAPDGTITRRIASVDLSTLSWTYDSENGRFVAQTQLALPNITNNQTPVVGICSKNYQIIGSDYTVTIDNSIGINFAGYIRLKDTSLSGNTSSITGIFYYELATPTTEQGTPFSENVAIDDFGSMEFAAANGVPTGASLFYAVDYKAFIDSLYNHCDGAADDIALKSDLASDKSELQGADTQLLNAIGGTLRQCLCVKESLDFEDTDFVDLGSQTIVFEDTFFGITISGIKNNGKALSTKYKVVTTYSDFTSGDKVIYVGTGRIVVKDSTYSGNVDTFKAAMKGVLLAYEKASS